MIANANSNSTLTICIHILDHDYSNLGTALNRALLYTQLCQVCRLANEQLQKTLNSTCCQGDGLVFGVHCATLHTPTKEATCDNNNAWINHLQEEMEGSTPKEVECIPHLVARYRYGNDVNDAWRIISTVLDLSAQLSRSLENVSIECLDDDDGQLLLIESAEVLPDWVDEDVSQGGVGGPNGCVNRCWIVDGLIRLIPPVDVGETVREPGGRIGNKVDLLSRREALRRLKGCIGSELYVVEEVQNAIEDRIAKTDYTMSKRSDDSDKKDCGASHFHVAAVAVPASVAYFLQKHVHLIPFLVDSFCNVAPDYLDDLVKVKDKECDLQSEVGDSETTPDSDTNAQSQVHRQQSKPTHARKSKQNTNLGNNFTYECIVLLPITMTRTTYAELITGRGKLPSFPIPKEYRSVELNRFQRQLLHMNGIRDVWKRAVEVGVRLCAGLDWILNSAATSSSLADEDSFMQSMGEVECRLRIHWCRIDAEARSNAKDDTTTSWIEETWQAGPNGSTEKVLSDTLQCMSKCHVFHPELSKPSHEEPCPCSRPGVSLQKMAQSGIKQALRYVREEYSDQAFPFPREWEVDDDSWMEVNSLEDLEDEMERLSSTEKQITKKPRRTTRRSRRNIVHNREMMQDAPDNKSNEVQSLNKMIDGFKSLVEGEGDHGGVVTHQDTASTAARVSPQQAMTKEVYINPRLFLDILKSKLHSRPNVEQRATSDQDVSKFFFKEDLEDSDESCDEDINGVEEVPGSLMQIMQAIRSGDIADQSVDFDLVSNLLSSLEAEGDTSGPVTTILRELGICPPRVSPSENE